MSLSVRRPTHSSMQGQAFTEYLILLVGIALSALGMVVSYGGEVKAAWEEAVLFEGWDLSALEDDDCPYGFSEATGRFYDTTTNLFVSNHRAGLMGCE